MTLAFGATLYALPSAAEACSCGGDAKLVWPADGGTLPANALLVFESECFTGIGANPGGIFTATVDGDEVEIVASTGGPLAGLGYRLEPPPPAGASVVLSNCGAREECVDPSYNQYVAFTVTDDDNAVPRPPALEGIDYVLAEAPLNCGEDPTPARDWTVPIKGESAADEPLLYAITLGPSGSAPTETTVFAVGAEAIDVVMRRLEEDAGKHVCAEVETFDLSGNPAAAVSSCRTLGQNETLEGCACSASSGPSAPAWALSGLVLLGLWRRRS
ncbi:MAG: MYXO-CTERM sorting domain-containing protein [Myxococcota bacterium]